MTDAWAEQWTGVWYNIGQEHEKRAEKEFTANHLLTARQAWLLATVCYRLAHNIIPLNTEQKIRLFRKVLKCYGKAAGFFEPPLEKIAVPYLDTTLPGYIWMPAQEQKPPFVIMVGGADGWREEFHNFCAGFIARGIGVLMVDGPGQGEARLIQKIHMPAATEKAFSASIDYLCNTRGINKDRIGIVGHSFGGYLVSRTAGYDKRVKACVCLGGFYSMLPHLYHDASLGLKNRFQTQFGLHNLAETEEMARHFTLKGIAENITCHLLVVHGKKDVIVRPEEAQQIYEEAKGPKEIVMLEDGDHCCMNHFAEIYPMIADWFADHL